MNLTIIMNSFYGIMVVFIIHIYTVEAKVKQLFVKKLKIEYAQLSECNMMRIRSATVIKEVVYEINSLNIDINLLINNLFSQ